MQEILDRYVGSFDWARLFSNAQVTNISFYHSDHRAVKLSLGSSWIWVRRNPDRRRENRFHFEEIWSRDEEYKEVVTFSWVLGDNLTRRTNMMERLRICAEKTYEWGFRKFSRMK